MNYSKLSLMLELIISRCHSQLDNVVVGLYAIRSRAPLTLQRYEQILDMALSDESANWTSSERRQMLLWWEEARDDGEKRMHNVKLTRKDWTCATNLGGGNASQGIRMALRCVAASIEA